MAVLGASGSGKSSVVRAGLVPRLRSDPETVWEVVTMVPTARPLNSLVNAFSPLLWPDLEDEVNRREKANEKTASLEKGTLSLRDLAEIALKKQPGTQRLLLVVDQWEELYTLCRDDKVIRSFTDQLLDASQTAPVTVVFTCRADFYGHVLDYRPLVDRIREEAQVSLGPMDERELREVVEAPAAKVGLEFEPGLSEANPRRHGPGTGTAAAALLPAGTAVEAAAGGGPDQRGVRRDGRGRGGHRDRGRGRLQPTPGTRPGTPAQALHPAGQRRRGIRGHATPGPADDPGRGGPAPRRELATARLLVTSSEQGIETVEVAHEALIRHWKRSKGWVNNARGFLTWRKRLEPFVDEWQKRTGTAPPSSAEASWPRPSVGSPNGDRTSMPRSGSSSAQHYESEKTKT